MSSYLPSPTSAAQHTPSLQQQQQQHNSYPSPSLPLSPQLDALLDAFTSLSVSLFTHLTSPDRLVNAHQHEARTLSICAELAALDERMARAIELVEKHQHAQSRILELSASIADVEARWRSTTKALHESVILLKPIVDSGALDRLSITASADARITASELLSYARLLAPFTSAPPTNLYEAAERASAAAGGVGGLEGLGSEARPPFPTEGMMRSGRLQFGSAGDALGGETKDVGAVPKTVLAPKLEETESERAERRIREQANRLRMQEEESRRAEQFSFDLDLNPSI